MGLLFGGSPKEVPFRRKVVLMLVYAAMKVGSFFIVSPLFKGEHCSALPSARAYLIVFAILCIATVPSQLFTNAIRLNKDLLPHMDSNVRADEGELYQGQKNRLEHRETARTRDALGRHLLGSYVVVGSDASRWFQLELRQRHLLGDRSLRVDLRRHLLGNPRLRRSRRPRHRVSAEKGQRTPARDASGRRGVGGVVE
mmetsp:Transcript_12088/g.36313  ORF Transcript_12088/g.36313 Transcript_12088/m.36313 type:complete len:198 (-) Transcript_12088:133-726(-)